MTEGFLKFPAHAPNCLRCRHFFVTWDPRFPRGCRVFGVKTQRLPSRVVYESTGRHCPRFERSGRIRDGHIEE
ncbi:MAG: hypothetical protein ACLFPO_05820 [Spirochaetaceae bacterium]